MGVRQKTGWENETDFSKISGGNVMSIDQRWAAQFQRKTELFQRW